MNKATARRIFEALASAEVPFQEIDSLVSDLEQDEKEKLVAILGQLITSHSELLSHLRMQFPEFDPEGEGRDLYQSVKNSFESTR